MVIWADRDTALPVEIDINLGMSYPDSLPAESAPVESVPSPTGEPARVKVVKAVVKIAKNYTLKNIRFDVPVDESLIAMPSDYKLIDMERFNALMREDGHQISALENGYRTLSLENGFLKMLRMWSEKLSDGFFPENLPPANFRSEFLSGFPGTMKLAPEERDELITEEVLRTVGLEHAAKQFLINLNPEEWEDFLITVSDGFRFMGNLENSGSEWQYSGSGVRLGEAREIFRYKMPDSSSRRVLYGDLHVEAIPADHARQ